MNSKSNTLRIDDTLEGTYAEILRDARWLDSKGKTNGYYNVMTAHAMVVAFTLETRWGFTVSVNETDNPSRKSVHISW